MGRTSVTDPDREEAGFLHPIVSTPGTFQVTPPPLPIITSLRNLRSRETAYLKMENFHLKSQRGRGPYNLLAQLFHPMEEGLYPKTLGIPAARPDVCVGGGEGRWAGGGKNFQGKFSK